MALTPDTLISSPAMGGFRGAWTGTLREALNSPKVYERAYTAMRELGVFPSEEDEEEAIRQDPELTEEEKEQQVEKLRASRTAHSIYEHLDQLGAAEQEWLVRAFKDPDVKAVRD